METLPLIQHIKPSYRNRHDYAIVATFNADLRFFEQKILANLRARNILFLMDHGQHRLITQRSDDAVLHPQFAGIRYQLAPVFVPRGVFHPKFILCLSEKHSRLILGSGNMGRQGYMANAELFSIIESDHDSDDETNLIVSEACNFLRELAESDFIASKAKEFILSALNLQPETTFSSEQRKHYFLHSMHQPILNTVLSKLDGQKISEIHILSPFLGEGTTLADNLLSRFGGAKCNIYLQNKRSQFDMQVMKKLHQQYQQIKFYVISATNESRINNTDQSSERYIHAKLLGFVSDHSAYSLTGSPNFTNAALGLSSLDGNIETAFFKQHDSLADFRELLKHQFINIHPLASLDDLIPESSNISMVYGSRPLLQVTSAKYNEHKLTIEFMYRDGIAMDLKDYQVVCLISGKYQHFPSSLRDGSTGILIVRCELPTAATFLWIEARRSSDEEIIMSDRQWVDFPQVVEFSETTFNQDDFDRCNEIGGIEGVREALQLAASDEQPDWLLAFLQAWNLSEILESGNIAARNANLAAIVGRAPTPPLETNYAFLQRGLDTLAHPDLEEILESVLQDYRDKITLWLEEGDAEGVRMGLQYILVFDLINLLLMKSFQRLIEKELQNKQHGITHQYGHARVLTHRFISHYLFEWNKYVEEGNLALYKVNDRKLPKNLFLYHNARAAIGYSLAKQVASQIDLEEPIVFNKILEKLIGNHAKERSRNYLHSADGVETLKAIVQNYDLIIRDINPNLDVEQLRKSLQKTFA